MVYGQTKGLSGISETFVLDRVNSNGNAEVTLRNIHEECVTYLPILVAEY